MPGPELVGYLKGYLGRPLIAYITGIADANTVSRWSSGKVDPERATWERLRTLATIHLALTRIVGSPESAGQWFTGWNPDLERSRRTSSVTAMSGTSSRRYGFSLSSDRDHIN